MLKNSIFLFSFLLLAANLIAQDYYSDIKQITEKIEQANSVHIESDVKVYSNKKSMKLLHEFQASIHKNEFGYRSTMDDVEIISTEKMLISIDHEEKFIQIENKPKLSKKDKEFLSEFQSLKNQDSLIYKIDLLSDNSESKTYQLLMKAGAIESIEITLSKEKNAIQKMIYHYNETNYPEASYVVIEYQKFQLNASIENDFILGKDIIQKSGGSLAPIGKYKEYQLLNLYQE